MPNFPSGEKNPLEIKPEGKTETLDRDGLEKLIVSHMSTPDAYETLRSIDSQKRKAGEADLCFPLPGEYPFFKTKDNDGGFTITAKTGDLYEIKYLSQEESEALDSAWRDKHGSQ